MTPFAFASGEMLSWTFPASMVPLVTSNVRDDHYSKRNARRVNAKADALFDLRPRMVAAGAISDFRPIDDAHITIVYVQTDRVRRDADNLAETTKPIIDALVECHIIRGDDWTHVPRVTLGIDHDPDATHAMWRVTIHRMLR